MNIELPPPQQSALEATNMARRAELFSVVQRMRPLGAGSAMPATGILGPGDYRGARLTGTVRVDGLGWPAVTGQVTLDAATAIVRGVVFEQPVVVTATTTVEFTGCVFLAAISVVSGGKVCCTGCRFDGTSAISHNGPATNVNRVGCTGTSVLAGDGNVTIVGGV